MNQRLLRIVPPTVRDGELCHRVMGTKVLSPNGDAIPGVTAVTITGKAGDRLWRAKIDCCVEAPEICVNADVSTYKTLSRFQRFVLRLIGIRAAEVTNLGSTEREFEAV